MTDARRARPGQISRAVGRNYLQEKQRLRTRQILIESALSVFVENGFLDATVGDILAKSGVSRAAFYAQFDGRLAIVQAIADEFEPIWQPVFEELAGLIDPSERDLLEWARRFLLFHRDHQIVCGLMSRIASIDDDLALREIRQQDFLINLLSERHPAFRAAISDPYMKARAHMLLGYANKLIFDVVHGRLAIDDEIAIRILADEIGRFLNTKG